jgi:hypothetical protein
MYIYHTYKYICMYGIYTHTPYRSVYLLVVHSYTIEDEVANPLAPRKYAVLNGNFVFNLHNFNLYDFFQEHNPGIKRDLPVV